MRIGAEVGLGNSGKLTKFGGVHWKVDLEEGNMHRMVELIEFSKNFSNMQKNSIPLCS